MQPTRFKNEYILRRATIEDVTFESEWKGKTWTHKYYARSPYAEIDPEIKYQHWINFKKFVAEQPKL